MYLSTLVVISICIISFTTINTTNATSNIWENVPVFKLTGLCAMRFKPMAGMQAFMSNPIKILNVESDGIVYHSYLFNYANTDNVLDLSWNDDGWIRVPDFLCNDSEPITINKSIHVPSVGQIATIKNLIGLCARRFIPAVSERNSIGMEMDFFMDQTIEIIAVSPYKHILYRYPYESFVHVLGKDWFDGWYRMPDAACKKL